jgi:hypothetical protein
MEVLATVRYLLKPEDVAIDNWVFRLHYRATVVLLLASSTVGFAKQYFGDPINCQVTLGPLGLKKASCANYAVVIISHAEESSELWNYVQGHKILLYAAKEEKGLNPSVFLISLFGM